MLRSHGNTKVFEPHRCRQVPVDASKSHCENHCKSHHKSHCKSQCKRHCKNHCKSHCKNHCKSLQKSLQKTLQMLVVTIVSILLIYRLMINHAFCPCSSKVCILPIFRRHFHLPPISGNFYTLFIFIGVFLENRFLLYTADMCWNLLLPIHENQFQL